MKCIIIDDEPLAVDVVESYVNQIEGLTLIDTFNNPLAAITLLTKREIDLVFLDIEMPNLTGLELVKNLDNLPQFIFTTAYPQYAIEGFELNATDYLLKPIPFSRFLKAVSRAREKFETKRIPVHNIAVEEAIKPVNQYIFVKSEYENIKIDINDIRYLQGLKDYIKIYTHSGAKSILTLSSFKEILEKLAFNKFIRVHRSYVVNIDHITAIQKNRILISDIRIPIGDTYKKEVFLQLGV